jgi:hypothetical protein
MCAIRVAEARRMIRPALALAAAAALAVAAAPAATAETFDECLAEQAANLNADCVKAEQVERIPRDRKAPRTVRVTWALGGCAGFPASGWEWRVRFIRDDRRGTIVPAELPDGTRRYVFGGTAQTGSRDVRLKRGAWIVDLGLDHAYSADGDCGGVDVRSQRFVVR